MAYCTECGAPNADGSAFCHNCGVRLAYLATDQIREDRQPQLSQSSSLPQTDLNGAETYRQQWEPMQSPHSGRRSSAGALVTFIVALFITGMLIWVATSPGLIHINLDSNSSTSSHNIQLEAGNYNATYSWEYPYGSNREWTIKVTIPATTYNYYSDPAKTTDYASYVTKDDPIVDRIATELKNEARNNSFDTAQFVLSFVQNVPYGTDENTTTPPTDNYPRYSDETLVDGVGDCKDHSVLYVSLMESPAINVDMVLFLLTKTGVSVGHMAAGMSGTGYTGTYVQYQGEKYYYCETTSPGWTIGTMPPEIEGYDVKVLAT